uniref:HTH cro/C1-type domain-containing protein n=1 Tax=Phenylobacterium glaciei TaxID=2803784 RepID=A0A974S7T2_9CAUL|nr:hypothetical protein JKL49_00720 [Phenylobacterium glaciei]
MRDIMRGKSVNPTLDTILGLARALGKDISEFVPSGALGASTPARACQIG